MTPSAPPAPTSPAADSADSAADPGQARFLTGEAVRVDVRLARLGSRVLARLIDLMIQVVLILALGTALLLLVGLAASFGAVGLDSSIVGAVYVVATVTSFIGYPVGMETLTRGATFGKLILGLRVVRDDGGPVTFRQALTRALVGTAIEFPGIIGAPLTWLATIATMLASPQGKRFGDHLAGTVVIHERTPAAWGWVPRMPPELAGWALTLDLGGLDDGLALAVRQYLARNRQIREPARTELGLRLAAEVAAVTNPPPPPGVAGWAYLAAVHAERHRRASRQLVSVRQRAATVWPDLVWASSANPAAVPLPIPPNPAATPIPAQVRSARPQ